MLQTDLSWLAPPQAEMKLAEDEVHVWRVSLQPSVNTLQRYQQVLSSEERAKAERFYFEKDRQSWTAARATLKLLLGCYLAIEPSRVQFDYNEYGKPHLKSVPESSWSSSLQFNISHSHHLALCAFAHKRVLGVDVEFMRPDIDLAELARFSFSPIENALFQSLPVEQREQAFFNCWTRKEAYIKARGMGLSLPLNLFDVSLRPGEPAALLASREDPREVTRWQFRVLEPGAGYAGALAVEGSLDWQLHCWQWQE